jgi:hypothetical protein
MIYVQEIDGIVEAVRNVLADETDMTYEQVSNIAEEVRFRLMENS